MMLDISLSEVLQTDVINRFFSLKGKKSMIKNPLLVISVIFLDNFVLEMS